MTEVPAIFAFLLDDEVAAALARPEGSLIAAEVRRLALSYYIASLDEGFDLKRYQDSPSSTPIERAAALTVAQWIETGEVPQWMLLVQPYVASEWSIDREAGVARHASGLTLLFGESNDGLALRIVPHSLPLDEAIPLVWAFRVNWKARRTN